MEFTMENVLNNWNANFPDYLLTVEELKKPASLMGAVFHVFDRLRIDRDAVLMPPTEKDLNENMVYYWDLIPVTNTTRVINHLTSVMAELHKISIGQFLQPAAATSRAILLLLMNIIFFNDHRLQSIAPYEDELFDVTNMVKGLEEKKNQLLEMLNNQAQEKAKRSGRMEQISKEIRLLEEELNAEEEARDHDKQQVDALTKENNKTDVTIDQKRAMKEGLIAERERKRALRVYDAEDVKAKAVQAAQSVQEAEEKLHSLGATIAQKESSLKVLQMIKPDLDTANNVLHEIKKLKDYKVGDLDAESKDGELDVLQMHITDLEAEEADLAARRAETSKRRQEGQAMRQQNRMLAESALREAEEKDEKRREFIAEAVHRTQSLKGQTIRFKEQKTLNTEEIQAIKSNYLDSVRAWEEAMLKLILDVKGDIDRKLHKIDDL